MSQVDAKAASPQRPYLAGCYLSRHLQYSKILASAASAIRGSERGEDFKAFAYKYVLSLSSAVQSCICYFPLPEFGSHPFDCSNALCSEEVLLPFELLGERYWFFLLPSHIQLTSPLLQGKSETPLTLNFFSTSVAGITKLLFP